jgi:hypothetical protein
MFMEGEGNIYANIKADVLAREVILEPWGAGHPMDDNITEQFFDTGEAVGSIYVNYT